MKKIKKSNEVFWKKVNIGNSMIWGVEHSFNIRLGMLALREMVTYTYGEDIDSHVPLSRIPPLKVLVGMGCNITEKVHAELITQFASKQDRLAPSDKIDKRIPKGGTPGYMVIDIRSSCIVTKNASLYLVIENLTNNDYKEHGSGVWGAGRGISVGLSVKTW
jgi:outer membrane receptor for ferrienterochelin and colicin